MGKKIAQADISRSLWSVLEKLRGFIGIERNMQYIFSILFLKYISDVWKYHSEKFNGYHCKEEKVVQENMGPLDFVLPKVEFTKKDRKVDGKVLTDEFIASYYSLVERKEIDNFGELINTVLKNIEKANRNRLEGVFRNIDFESKENFGNLPNRNRFLKKLIELFNTPQFDLRPNKCDINTIGNACDYLIEKASFFYGSIIGELCSPTKLAILVARLAKPGIRDSICDPTCGLGGFLIQTERVKNSNGNLLFGQEINEVIWSLCILNLFLHGYYNAKIELTDTLKKPLLAENERLMKFDCIVSNPPFISNKWEGSLAKSDLYNRFWRGIPPKNNADWAFISHMVETAKNKKGRVVVVLPHGVLFRGGKEKCIRQKMIEENLLDAVIGLPNKLFPTTTIPVVVLIFDKSREKEGIREKCRGVLIIDASHDFIPNKTQNILSDENIDKIVETYGKYSDSKNYSHLASYEEIKENDYNLGISRYVNPLAEKELDIDKLQLEINFIEKEITLLKKEIANKLQCIRKEVCNEKAK